MRTFLGLLALFCGTFVTVSLIAWASEKDESAASQSIELRSLMRAKLACSQTITEGLVARDFVLIRKGAAELRQIAAATKWYSHDDPVYAHHRSELSAQAEKLIHVAEEKNIDAAALTYVRTLTTCISCHEYCRDALHMPEVGRNPKTVTPIPVTDEEPNSAASPASSR
jgi:hypothetical protein